MRTMLRPSTHRFGSWLALAVFALNAFWPLVSLANPGGSKAWMAVCTTAGMQQIAATADETPTDGSAHHVQMPQCPLCAVAGMLEMSPPPVFVLFTVQTRQVFEPVFIALPATSPVAYAPAQPRAPPFSS
jgi:hypothetical protein